MLGVPGVFMRRITSYVSATLFLVALSACSGSDHGTGVITPPTNGSGNVSLKLTPVATGLTAPVHLSSPANDSRIFVVEQPGRIRIIQNGVLLTTPFLDISSDVLYNGERGLLSVAFHPNYATNGYFYINYVGLDNNTHVERVTVSSNANVANAASRTEILEVPQTSAGNHKGGLNVFGPDGYLYIGTGESGVPANAQLKTTLLGKMLRIDVDHIDPGKAYAVPSTNPFVGQAGALPEIWATGLRNPWRYSFDATTNQLYLADVGQDTYEEVNVVGTSFSGLNYGWSIMEGGHCYGAASCTQTGLSVPVLEYTHADGCAIVGGYVYRGSAIPELTGHYFYGDYCNGWVKSFTYATGVVSNQKSWSSLGGNGNILSFGRDASGELYILTAGGTVYRIDKV
jgi:glucose/arabinose dehydrogenase